MRGKPLIPNFSLPKRGSSRQTGLYLPTEVSRTYYYDFYTLRRFLICLAMT